MVLCFVPDCHHKSDKDGCSMFRFPDPNKSPKRREKWIDLVRRKDKVPNKNSRVCSCHFESLTTNETVIPTIFQRNIRKKFSPEMKTCKYCKKYEDTARQNIICEEQLQEKEKIIVELQRQIASKEVELSSVKKNLMEETMAKSALQNKLEAEQAKCVSLTEELEKKEAAIVILRAMLEEEKKKKMEELEKEKFEKDSLRHKFSEKEINFKLTNIDNIINTSEIDRLKKEMVVLQNQKKSFHVEDIQDHRLISHFTGLPNKKTFDLLLGLFDGLKINYYMKWNVECLSRSQQLLMTLMKLRRNLSNIDLSLRFNVSTGTVSNVILTWIHALHIVLVENLMSEIPSRHKNKASMPKSFASYASCRIILDCTEMFAANPKQMNYSNNMYSSYKHRITVKGLVGIAPNGTVTFLSRLYGGSTSDKNIVEDSGIIEKLTRGDYVMADKGFLIGDILPAGVTLNIPPFKTGPQMTPSQVSETLSIAQARIHVERAIQRIKLFRILEFIPGSYVMLATKIFQVCGALTNFMKPLIQEVALQMFCDDNEMIDGVQVVDGDEIIDIMDELDLHDSMMDEDINGKENS